MRIGIDGRMLGKKMTGIGRYTQNLIRHLLETDDKNQYVLILNENHPAVPSKEKDRFKVVRVGFPPLSIYTLFWLNRIIRREKIDLFHSPFFLAPLWAPCPVVITVHDLMGLKYPSFFEGRNPVVRLFARFFVKLFVPIALRRASKIIAVSETTKKELVEYLDLPEDKIKVIYEGIESCFKKDLDFQLANKMKSDFQITKKIILYIGNTRPYKNLPRLIKAFNIFQKEFEGYQLVIGTGDTRKLNTLKKIVTQLALEQKVIFTGSLQDDDIVALMNSAQVFVFPSLWEGFGFPPLEAMACGLSVISSKAGSLPEILGEAAFLVNPENEGEIAEGIKQVLINESLREQLIKRGLERVRLFSWEKTANDTLKLYKELIKEN
ncbi:MAG: glycosyltransferase family 1 protein [candidate division Zixibacteria bacterium]|nr:glycosyltransferase family 1 protein [candidate division Zixibacteria bacterium]